MLTEVGQFPFRYSEGETMIIDGSFILPRFSGRHEQRDGCVLRTPTAGDVLLVEVVDAEVMKWGYMEHFVDLSKRLALRLSAR